MHSLMSSVLYNISTHNPFGTSAYIHHAVLLESTNNLLSPPSDSCSIDLLWNPLFGCTFKNVFQPCLCWHYLLKIIELQQFHMVWTKALWTHFGRCKIMRLAAKKKEYVCSLRHNLRVTLRVGTIENKLKRFGRDTLRDVAMGWEQRLELFTRC